MEQENYNPTDPTLDNTLDEMRGQIALLKEKLDRETIVNDRLLRDAMRGKIGVIRTNAIIEYVCVVLCFIAYPTAFIKLGFSWWLVGITLAMTLFAGIMTAVQHRHMNALNEGEDLLTVARNARRLKQDYVDWLKWSILMVIFWFSWLVTECFIRIPDRTMGIGLAVGGCFGLIIGACVGLSMRRKVIHACEDIIRQIEGAE